MQTIFQKIIDKEIPAKVVYEDDRVLAFLDISPKTNGHTLVIPKKYSRNIISINSNDLEYLILKTREIANHIISKLNVDGYKVIANSEASSDQEVFHTHFHIVPSKSNKKFSIEEIHNMIKMIK